MTIQDSDLLALNGFKEANMEPDDGLAAVVRVTLNRTVRKYESTGTISSTVYGDNQFSWTQYDDVGGKYEKVTHDLNDEIIRVGVQLRQAQQFHNAWARALRISAAVAAGTYKGPDYNKITDDTVLYLNPDPRIVPHLPAWASPGKLVTIIGRHHFFRA